MFGLNTFSFEPSAVEGVKWDKTVFHHMIDAADLPASTGISIKTVASSVFPHSIYLWVTISNNPSGLGNSEFGVTVDLSGWQKPVVRDTLLPVLERTSDMDTDSARWLWEQVPDTAQRLLQG
jgi:hypothetical protein